MFNLTNSRKQLTHTRKTAQGYFMCILVLCCCTNKPNRLLSFVVFVFVSVEQTVLIKPTTRGNNPGNFHVKYLVFTEIPDLCFQEEINQNFRSSPTNFFLLFCCPKKTIPWKGFLKQTITKFSLLPQTGKRLCWNELTGFFFGKVQSCKQKLLRRRLLVDFYLISKAIGSSPSYIMQLVFWEIRLHLFRLKT